MAKVRFWLIGVAGAALLGGCAEAGFAQDAHVVSAGSLGDDAAPQDDYRWIDRARALWNAVGDAPPDYGFGFDGGTPSAWETRDGYWVVVEDRAEGTRTYFFAPGERGPFLVRETDRSFGYAAGHVAAVYDGAGTLLPRYLGARWLDEGEDLYRRGRRLRDALLDRQWQPVDTTSWVNLNLFFLGIDQRWDSGWRYRAQDAQALADQRRWAEEAARRAAMASAFEQWRHGGFQGPPPPGLGHHWEHRPPRPGDPPRPGPPPGAGRPPRPDRPDGPGGPGAHPPGPPPPRAGDADGGPPRPERPDRPHGWGQRPPGGSDAGVVRPDRPHGQGPRPGPVTATSPGMQTPGADVAPPPTAPNPDAGPTRPPRPAGTWEGREDGPRWQGRPGWTGAPHRPDPAAPAAPPPAAQPAAPPPAHVEGERRGGWMTPSWARPPRPEGAAPPAPAPHPSALPLAMHPAPPPPAAHVSPPPPPRPAPAPGPVPHDARHQDPK